MSDHPDALGADTIAALLVDTEPYLSCDDCFERIDEHVERCLADPDHDDPLMRTHLAGCGACAEEAATLRDLLRQDGA